jgi:hypothetical protein
VRKRTVRLCWWLSPTVSHLEIGALERDVLEVLSLVRFVRNTFALVNRTPPKLLSHIPNSWKDSGRVGVRSR